MIYYFFFFSFCFASIIYNQIPNQYVPVDRSYDFILPLNSFEESDGKQLDYEITNPGNLPPSIEFKKIVQPLSPAYLGSYPIDIDNPSTDSSFILNNIAYIAASYFGLLIIDVSNPSSPYYLGSYGGTGSTYGVFVVNDIAYVANYEYGLQIIDVSYPSSPYYLGSFHPTGGMDDMHSYGVYVVNDIAYLAVGNGPYCLSIVNVSNPFYPLLLGQYSYPGTAYGVFVVNDIAYIADYSDSPSLSLLLILNVSNPSSPSLLGQYITPGQAFRVYVVNDIAYVADYTAGLLILNVSNPSSPVLLSMYFDGSSAVSVYVQNDIAYVAYGIRGLSLIDVSNPSSPSFIRFYYTLGRTQSVTVLNEIAYVTNYETGFRLINISITNFNPYSELLAINTKSIYVRKNEYNTSIAYGNDQNLNIVNVSDPSSPSLLGSYDLSDNINIVYGAFLVNDIAYVAGHNGILIMDVSNPSPSLLGAYDSLPIAFRAVYVFDSIAYAAAFYSGVFILDVSNSSSPLFLGSYDTPGGVYSVYVQNDIAYVADYHSGLQILNVSNHSSPSLLGSYNTPGYATEVYVKNDIAYIADRDSLQMINITDPSSPSLLGSYPTSPFDIKNIFIQNDIVYASYGVHGLLILDVSNPASPLYLGIYPMFYLVEDSFLYNEMLYVADYYFGMRIIIPFNYPSLQGITIPDRNHSGFFYDIDIKASNGPDSTSGSFRLYLYGIVLPNANNTLTYPLNNVYVVASGSVCSLNISISDPSIGSLNTRFSIYDAELGLLQAAGNVDDINNDLLGLSLNYYPSSCSKGDYITFNFTFSLFDDHSGLIDERIITIEDQCIFYLNSLIPDQYWIVEEDFNFQFLNSTFIDNNDYEIFYNVSSPSYTPFPEWLSFNTENRTFFASALDSFDDLPASSIYIRVLAWVEEYRFIANTSFTLYLLHATKTNTTSVLFPDVYLFDILNYDPPIEYISFSLTNASLIPSEELASLELISDLVFTGDNSSNFNCSFVEIDEENFKYSIVISVITPSISAIGTLSSSLSIYCDFPHEDRLCAMIPFSINIIGPLATLSKSIIDFGIMSKYDILSRNYTDYAIKKEIILITNHSSDYSDITPPNYTLNPSISYNSTNSILFSSSIIPNINHDLLINITINNYFEGPFNYQVTLTCHIQDLLHPIPCGSFSIIGTISIGSTFIYNDTTQIFFNLNSYDMLVRDESYLLHSFYIYPNNILPLIESISPITVLNPYTEIKVSSATNVSLFSTVTIENNSLIIFDLYLTSAEPLLNLSSQLIIYSIGIDSQLLPDYSECAHISVSGNIQSPIYSLSTQLIRFNDFTDDEIVQENPNNYSFIIKVNNTIPIPFFDKDDLYFIFDTDCSIIDYSDTFYISEILHENMNIPEQSHLLFIQDRYVIDLNFTNIKFPKDYYADIECTINDPYYSDPTETIPIELKVIGGFPLISPSDNISFGHFIFDSFEELFNWQGIQITLNLSNIGNDNLNILSSQINQPSESTSSFFLTQFACQFGSLLYPSDFCLYNVSFLPARDGSFDDISIFFYFDSAFKSSISIPIRAIVHFRSELQSKFIDFIVDIYPYLAVIFGFLLLLLIILVYLKKRLKIENQETSLFFVAILSIYDFIADILFTLSLFTSSEPGSRILFLIATGTIVVSFLINIIVLFSFIKNQLNTNPAFSEWFSKNSTKLGFVIFLSSTNLAVAKLMASNILKLGIFSAPITVKDQYRLDSYSIITQFTENIPQLALQLYIAFSVDVNDWPTILIFSLFGSILMIIFGLINRTLSWLFVCSKSKKDILIPNTAKESNAYNIGVLPPEAIELPIKQNFEKSTYWEN